MKKTCLILALVVLFLIAGCSTLTQTSNGNKQSYIINQSKNQTSSEKPMEEEPPLQEPASQTYSINIKSYAFSPVELKIKKGDTVTWTNNDAVSHTVTSDSGSELNSDALPQGESYSHTFNAQGTYEYHCKPHPFMKAKIIVE